MTGAIPMALRLPRLALVDRRTADPAALDRLADAELQAGHVAAAERLAWLAAEMRAGVAP